MPSPPNPYNVVKVGVNGHISGYDIYYRDTLYITKFGLYEGLPRHHAFAIAKLLNKSDIKYYKQNRMRAKAMSRTIALKKANHAVTSRTNTGRTSK